jgi:hypothetical protein
LRNLYNKVGIARLERNHMPRSKKYAQRSAKGCRLCGDPEIGRGIQNHVKETHSMKYEDYCRCFEKSGKLILDQLLDIGKTTTGKRIIMHFLVKRFELKR